MSWYLKVGNRLENLFSLVTGSSLALETLFVENQTGTGTVLDGRLRECSPFDSAECIWCNPHQLARCMDIWLSADEAFVAVENVALGVARKGKLFLETQFLTLAQALEGLHRATAVPTLSEKTEYKRMRTAIRAVLEKEACDPALKKRVCDALNHVQEISFAERVTELLGRFSSDLLLKMKIDAETFVRDVTKTRNAYTHAGGTRPGKRAPLAGRGLLSAIRAMRALLRGLLLLHLEIPEEQFTALVIRHVTGWR